MTIAGNYKLVQSVAQFERDVNMILEEGKAVGIDTETGYDGPDRKDAAKHHYYPLWKLVGLSYTNSTKWARYVPVAHDLDENVDDVYLAAKVMWRLVNSGLCVTHNAGFELAALSRWFREVLSGDAEVGDAVRSSKGLFPVRSDTFLEAFLLQAYAPKQQGGPGLGLKGLSFHKYGHRMTEFEELFPTEDSELGPGTPARKKNGMRFNTRRLVPKVINYACEDALICLKLHQDHYPILAKERGFILKVETALLPVITEMEIEGLELDWAEYERRSVDVAAFLAKMEEEIQVELSRRTGELVAINLASPPQVAKMLYETLKLPVKKETASGKPSTNEAALRSLAKQDPTIRRILEFREVKKLQGSYIDKYLKELRYASDGRAHPNHNQAGTVTGRMSVDHVSYQQWPKKYHYELEDGTTLDLNYKNFLISPPGFRMIGFDFSQVELRVLAGMANEQGLLEAFAAGTDIHKATASIMMGIPLDEVTDKDRAKGKTLNFAIVYGSGAKNIGELLGISTDEAQQLLDQYFRTFKGLKGWMDERRREGAERGWVETMFKRKFKVWEYEDPRPFIQAKGDRMCVNAPVQGGAADYMKLGMIRVNKAIKAAGLQDKIRLFITVHDNLEFYVHESISTQEAIDLIRPEVSFHVDGLPEIKADWHEGKRWGEVFEIELDADGQIAEYSYTPAPKVKLKGSTYGEVEAQYLAWKKNPPTVSEPEVSVDEPAPFDADTSRMVTAMLVRIVTVGSELTQQNKLDLKAFLEPRFGGPHSVVLQLANGREAHFSGGYDITDLDGDLLSDILGGARLHFERLDVAA